MPNHRPFALMRLTYLAGIGVFLLSILTVFPQWHRLLELFCHFKITYLSFALILLPVTLFFRHWWLVGALLVAVIINGCQVIPWYLSPHSNHITADATHLKLVHANVHSSNQDYDRLHQLVAEENPDLLLLQEISGGWQSALQSLQSLYPYQFIRSRPDNFGIAVLSRLPLEISTKHWGDLDLPSLLLTLQLGKQKLHLAYSHPMPPLNADYQRARDQQLRQMMAEVSQIAGYWMVCGDFNVSMWSSSYPILNSSHLTNARQGFGPLATWPTAFGPLGIPIDQLLVSPQISVLDLRRGPDIGSDHWPLVAELVIPATRENLVQ